MTQNKHGLSRTIPESVKSTVRKRCGFGCAICGVTITEYEHFFPDFADAKIHDPNRLVLLCPKHHVMATKGIIPKAQIAEASLNPVALTQGFSKEDHPWFRGIPSLKFGGGSLISETRVPLRVKGIDIIKFDPPEEGSEVSRISALLQTAAGEKCLSIERNEWKVFSGHWDFVQKGNRYIFKDLSGIVFLQLRMDAPKLISIEKLMTSINGVSVDVDEDRMMVGSNRFEGGIMSRCQIGMMIG